MSSVFVFCENSVERLVLDSFIRINADAAPWAMSYTVSSPAPASRGIRLVWWQHFISPWGSGAWTTRELEIKHESGDTPVRFAWQRLFCTAVSLLDVFSHRSSKQFFPKAILMHCTYKLFGPYFFFFLKKKTHCQSSSSKLFKKSRSWRVKRA